MLESGTDLQWIEWVRALQAISQTGLHYAKDPYDIQRYPEIQRIASDMLAGVDIGGGAIAHGESDPWIGKRR